MCKKIVVFRDTDWQREADGVDRYKQTTGEGREVPGATHDCAGVGLCQGYHAIRTPLLLTLTEVLTQRDKHPDLQTDTNRPRGGAAGRAHVDKVVQSGVVRPVQHRVEGFGYKQIAQKQIA